MGYKDLDLPELKKLYANLIRVINDMSEEREENLQQMASLCDRRDELVYIKKRIEDITSNNSMPKSKRYGYAMIGTCILSIGADAYLGTTFTSQSKELLPLILSGAITLGTGMGTYIAFSSYRYDKHLVEKYNILGLNPNISRLNKQIEEVAERIKFNQRILAKCKEGLPLVRDRIFELSHYPINSEDSNKTISTEPKKLVKSPKNKNTQV